jgi:hypothetical protein
MNEKENIIQDKDLANDERISRFMQGLMEADEEAAFQIELKNNEELRNQAIAQARLVKGMKQVDEEQKGLFRQTDEQTIRNIANRVTARKNRSTRWLAIAASIVFIVFVGFKSYDYYDTTNLGKEYANAFPTSSIVRGESNVDVESELKVLFDNVAQNRDLDNTTSRLKTLWELSKQETYNDYTDYCPYIGWNLAIGYLENYEKTKAKDVLIEMKQTYPEGTALGDKVVQLINEM